jgi:4-hydroxy-tetrahydrodipicolinate reductase
MASDQIDIAITGAAGRMGQRLVALAKADGGFNIVGAIERPDHEGQGRDAGEVSGVGPIGVPITFDLKKTPKVLIDFTIPASTRHWLKTCRDRGIAMLIGTTGLQNPDHAAIEQASSDIPILQSSNMALAVFVLFKLAAEAAKLLGDDYDIEIHEIHHRFKKDSPSGTALELADSILKATGKKRDSLVFGRHGDQTTRKRGEVGMHSLRLGDEVGKHSVFFAALGERLELTHNATNRDTFVHGALRAAKWLATQRAGRYTVANVLGI